MLLAILARVIFSYSKTYTLFRRSGFETRKKRTLVSRIRLTDGQWINRDEVDAEQFASRFGRDTRQIVLSQLPSAHFELLVKKSIGYNYMLTNDALFESFSAQKKPLLLIVDDIPSNLEILSSGLQSQYRLIVSRHGHRALQLARERHPDLILLDIMMPEMDGFQVCQQLKQDERLAPIPVIFLTALTDNVSELKGLEVGAVDYIYKPFNLALIKARITTHLQASQTRMALMQSAEALQAKSQALQEKAETIQKHVSLREDVDRILRHDMKTPLSPIIGFSELMLMDDNLTEEQRENLNIIRDAGQQMLRMINRSLDLYKMETGRYQYAPVVLDACQTIHKVVSGLHSHAQHAGVIMRVIDNDQAPKMVFAEDLLLYILMNNLIQNAIEASTAGDEITIQSVAGLDQILSISVTNPALVPEEIRDQFFEKYVTCGKERGTGLGTYSAKIMAETMRGSISMTSQAGQGTCVTVNLPIAIV
jgi:DNA-binding response OmpR family regulator